MTIIANKLRFSILLIFCLVFTDYGADEKRYVIIISVDGLRPDAINKHNNPTMYMMKEKGADFINAMTISPSITLPSHTSMLTGMKSSRHKILWNRFRPKEGTVKVATCFQIARKAGKKTAMFVGKEKLKHLQQKEALDYFDFPGYKASKVAGSFSNYVAKKGLPELSFLHFSNTDGAGHKYGWMSKKYIREVAVVDRSVNHVLDIVKKADKKNNTIVILTADHGGKGHSHKKNIAENRKIPLIVYGPQVLAQKNKNFIYTYDTAATSLWLLGLYDVNHKMDGKPLPIKLTKYFKKV